MTGPPTAPGSVVGIDLGKTTIRASAFSTDELVALRPSVSCATPNTGVRPIIDACASLVAAARDETTRAVGVGTFGITDPVDGRVIKSGSLPFWNDVHLAADLLEACGLPAFVLNDVAATALGIRSGLMRGGSIVPFAVIQLGTSVGVSAAGGHLDAVWQRPDFGQVSGLTLLGDSPLNIELGGRGLAARASRALGSPVETEYVFTLAARGHPVGAGLVSRYFAALTELMSWLTALLNPTTLHLLGGVSQSLVPSLERIRQAYAQRVAHLSSPAAIEIAPWNHVSELGAALWALRNVTATDA